MLKHRTAIHVHVLYAWDGLCFACVMSIGPGWKFENTYLCGFGDTFMFVTTINLIDYLFVSQFVSGISDVFFYNLQKYKVVLLCNPVNEIKIF